MGFVKCSLWLGLSVITNWRNDIIKQYTNFSTIFSFLTLLKVWRSRLNLKVSYKDPQCLFLYLTLGCVKYFLSPGSMPPLFCLWSFGQCSALLPGGVRESCTENRWAMMASVMVIAAYLKSRERRWGGGCIDLVPLTSQILFGVTIKLPFSVFKCGFFKLVMW